MEGFDIFGSTVLTVSGVLTAEDYVGQRPGTGVDCMVA